MFINKPKQHITTMKKIYNYILLSALAFASASCINEEFNPDQPTAETGDEVKFGLSLGDPKTKTVYGDETNNHTFPIYWIDGDKVQVFSPQCLEGRRSAEYKVILPSGVTNPNYAEDLAKTGEYGVQWGNNETADFYSLYPSGNYTLSSDGGMAENITIGYTQSINVNGTTVKSDMEDCLMYAKTTDVSKGQIVNLRYAPISTVVMVTLKVAENAFGADAESFTIQSITLTAPEGTDIAGTFSLNIADGKFGGFTEGKASNTIITQIVNTATGGYHTLANGQSVTVPLFLAPAEYTSVKDWKVQVVANGDTYTKTLKDIETALEPGKIHKITLPDLKPATTEWDVSKWMTYIPRNVYLSEVSIPGSWNSLNPEFQGTSPTIDGQYSKGARAFHLDTRWQGSGRTPLDASVSNVLGVADGGSTVEYITDGRVMTANDNPSVENALDKMIKNIRSDEYMILICTFAQGSYNHSYTSNNVTYDWVGEISRICALKDKVYDAKALTPNTLVGDVLGKVIVIVNTEDELSAIPSDSKCLFVNIPLTLDSSLFGSDLNNNIGGINKGTLNSTGISDTGIDMYNTQAQVCIAGETYTGSQNRDDVDGRGFAPTFGERKTVANNILTWSQTNYGNTNYAHDKWIYLGLGGYYVHYARGTGFDIVRKWRATDTGHEDVAADLNGWINGKVTEMGTTPSDQTTAVPYYPVGIVLMNYVNNYTETVKNILLLNNKYRLQYDSSKPSDYNPQALSLAEYGATATVGGDAF